MITRGIEIAAKGMMSLIDKNDAIANNIANVNTSGFKKTSLLFKNVYNAQIEQPEPNSNAKYSDFRYLGEMSMGSQTQKLVHEFSQGTLSRTDKPLDVAIEGDGFFKVQEPSGKTTYTRNGNFLLDSQRNLVTTEGDLVLDDRNRPIRIDVAALNVQNINDIVISEDGQIQVNSEKAQILLQTIGVWDFQNKEDMLARGTSKYEPRDINTNPELKSQKFKIQQGALELSNSNVISEMINMINTSRNYETLSKFVKTDGDLLSRAINIGRVS